MVTASMSSGELHQKEAAPVLQTEAVGDGDMLSADDDCITPEEFEARKRLVMTVEHEYFEANPRKGELFTNYARDCVAAGRKFSIYERGQWVTWFNPSDSHGKDWGVNHNHVPILARLVVERVPECYPYIQLKPSKFDVVFDERLAFIAAKALSAEASA